ncbi:MAG: hypothetical protein IJX61_02505 [Ruminococcus sp.]|nr:hypothetical protein [Ruminococcus sp.]
MKLAEKITALAVMTAITAASAAAVFNGNFFRNMADISSEKLLEGGFADELAEKTADSFPFAKELRAVAAEIGAKAGEPVVNRVYISEDRLLSADEYSLSAADNCTAAVNAFSAGYEGAVYFTAVPTSTGIYGDSLPSYLLPVTEKQLTERIYEGMSSDIRKIDAYTILKNLSENYIYYRSDTKWTSYGAYCVYRTVIQKLGFIPVPYDKYAIHHVTDSYRGNLYNCTGYMESRADILDIYEYDDGTEIISCTGIDSQGVSHEISLYDMEAAESENPYDLYLGEPMEFVEIKTTVNNEKALLVIGDETADCFIPFLTKHYSEIAIASADNFEQVLEKYTDTKKYEQTLFILGMEHIAENYRGE